MRIAMISAPELNDRTDPLSAPDSQLPPLAAALADRGHDTTIYTPIDDAGHKAPTGAQIASLPTGEPGDDRLPTRYAAALADRWREEPPDVVHAFGCCAGLATVAARTSENPLPHIQDYRALTATSRSDERRARLEAALGCRADRAVAASPGHADALAARGIPRSHLAIVPYGIDIDRYHPDQPQRASTDRYRLVCAGGYADPGLPDLIRALPRIPRAEVFLTGGAAAEPHTASDDAGRVGALAEHWGVADQVRFLDDLDDAERALLYQSADLVVSGPTWAATGVACLQAMACGAPVVATTPDGEDDTVLDGVSGVVIPTGHTDRLADTVRQLLDDPARRLAYGIAGADRASVCYRWDRVAIAAEIVYTRATSSGRFAGTPIAGTYAPSLSRTPKNSTAA